MKGKQMNPLKLNQNWTKSKVITHSKDTESSITSLNTHSLAWHLAELTDSNKASDLTEKI